MSERVGITVLKPGPAAEEIVHEMVHMVTAEGGSAERESDGTVVLTPSHTDAASAADALRQAARLTNDYADELVQIEVLPPA